MRLKAMLLAHSPGDFSRRKLGQKNREGERDREGGGGREGEREVGRGRGAERNWCSVLLAGSGVCNIALSGRQQFCVCRVSFSVFVLFIKSTELNPLFLEKTRLLSSLKMSVSAVLKDVNDSKLQLQSERLRESFRRGEPKAMAVTEIMLGLMTVTIAMPLIASNPTHTVNLLAPWWSGAVFVISGAVAVATEKQPTICNMRMCLLCTALGVVASFTSLIVYTVDLSNATLHCTAQEWKCKEQELATMFSSGLKSILLTYSVTQLIIGGVLLYLLNKERRSFSTYNTLDFNSQSGPDSELLRS